MLTGKTAVITGARRGIGRKTVEVFAKNGADVFACARKEDEQFERDMTELATLCQVKVIPVYFDVTDEDEVKEAVKRIRKECPRIDILANIAGMADFSTSFLMTPIDKMRRTFEVNFWGTTLVTQYISRLMMRYKSGSIINISSMSGLEGTPAQYEYASSKAAVIGGARQLARELAPYHIRVNTVAPGIIATDMGGEIEPELRKRVMTRIMMDREGTPEEVANVIAFLGSDLSSYMTGQIIRVDGGD